MAPPITDSKATQIMPPAQITSPSFVAYEVDGGLDLVTSATHVRPGAMIKCQNYEVARQRGARRIDGYEKFDGGVSPSFSALVWKITFTGTNPENIDTFIDQTNYVIGNVTGEAHITFDGRAGVIGTIVFTAKVNTTTAAVYFITSTPEAAAALQGVMSGFPEYAIKLLFFIGPGASSYSYTMTSLVSNAPLPSVSAAQTASTLFFGAVNPTIQQVPGQGNINGLFYLKDKVYATRDMLAIPFTAGTTTPNLMDVLYQGASFAAATWSGVLAKMDGVTGSWSTGGDAAGVVMVYNTTGSIGAGTVKNHSQSDAVVFTADVASRISPPSTAGALYRADGARGATIPTQSWQVCDLGWSVPYVNGGSNPAHADFLDMNVAFKSTEITDQLKSTTWHKPIESRAGGWSTFNGSGADPFSNAATRDTGDLSYVGWSGSAHQTSPGGNFTLTNFGFNASDIPFGATITGLELEIKRGTVLTLTGGATFTDLWAVDGPIVMVGLPAGTNHSFGNSTTPWTVVTSPTATNYQAQSYGGQQELFGFTNVDPAVFMDPAFGLRFTEAWHAPSAPYYQTASRFIEQRINNVQMRIWYLPQSTSIYFWNGTTAVKANVVQHYKSTGNVQTSDAAGVLYFQFVQADGTIGGQPSRPIGGNEDIRTYPVAGIFPDISNYTNDTLLANTSAIASMNVMDWSSLIAAPPLQDGTSAPPSKYQYVAKNFYASTGFDALYGVSGAGPAFYYDGINSSRIQTGLTGVLESPRHITEHQGHIVLGYYSGITEWSNSDNVLTFDPVLNSRDAGGQGFGEAIRGMHSMNGDALAVWTRTTVKMIQGQLTSPAGNPISAYVSIVSPTSGGIEYTMQPMQTWMYADFRGVTSVKTTQAYGDFEIGHISAPVAPFLIPRLQLTSRVEGGNIGPINSYLVRNKNQYRLLFGDGVQMTTTFLADGEPPQITTQKYFHNDGVTPMTWDVIIADTQSTGQDHIYGATNDGTGWVYELERGTSFDGGVIPAYAIISGNDLQAPYSNKMWFDAAIHGVAKDYATFNVSRSPNYVAPTYNPSIPMVFGSTSAMPTGEISGFVSFNVIQMEGRSINIRIDSSHNDQFPHDIQTIVLSAKTLQEKRT